MDSLIQEAASKTLNGEQMLALVKGKANIVLYKDLANYSSLQEAAGEYGACVCLIESEHLSGHWVGWFEVDADTWEWFDSYGTYPGSELKWVKNPELKEQQTDIITKLVADASESTRMIFNQVPLQELSSKVNTCGRWVGMRIRRRELPLKKFQELFYKQRQSPDWLITALTIAIVN